MRLTCVPGLAGFCFGVFLAAAAAQPLQGPIQCRDLGPPQRELCERANSGDAAAIAAVAWDRFHGRNGPADFELAARLFGVLIGRGDVEGLIGHGMLYEQGRVVQADPVAARALFRAAMAQGSMRGQAHYADYLMFGLGGPEDRTEATRLLEAADAAGDAYAPYVLATAAREGRGAAAEPAAMLALYRRSAERGHPSGLNSAAWFLARANQELPAALDFAERAVALEPTVGAYVHTLGYVLRRMGNETRSFQLFERAARLAPGCALCREHWGDALAAMGRKNEAMNEWRAALQANDGDPDFDAAALRTRSGL